MKARLLTLAAAAAIGYGLLLLWLWAAQRSLVYFPGPSPGRPPRGTEELRCRTADGLELLAWFRPAAGPRKGAVLLLHGNGGDRSGFSVEQDFLAARGWDSLALDWRGYGGNPGRPDEAGLLEDARAGLGALAARTGLPRERLALLGFSLGAAVALLLAAEQQPAAVVALAPFTSLPDAAARHYPWAPIRLLARDRFEALAAAPRVRCPVLVAAGLADTLIPPEHGRRIARALPRGTFAEVPEAGHNDLLAEGGAELRARIEAFFALHIAP